MASFVIDLVIKNLAESTVRGYLWAVVDWHEQNGYTSPLESVFDWQHFMRGVEITICEDGNSPQSRRQIPLQIVAGALSAAKTDCRFMVMTACCILISLFGVKRHQYLSKTKDGFNSAHRAKLLKRSIKRAVSCSNSKLYT